MATRRGNDETTDSATVGPAASRQSMGVAPAGSGIGSDEADRRQESIRPERRQAGPPLTRPTGPNQLDGAATDDVPPTDVED